MTSSRYRVALVVDPEFGERIVTLSRRLHVWVVASPTNLRFVERCVLDDGQHEQGVTTFTVRAGASPTEIAIGQLWSIDLHHGEYSHSPPLNEIEIYGAQPTPELLAALEEFDLNSIVLAADHFIATQAGSV